MGQPGVEVQRVLLRYPTFAFVVKREHHKILMEQTIPYFLLLLQKDDPKIAISVYVENAGFGATWAAPIASLMIEKYPTGFHFPSLSRRYILTSKPIDRRAKKK
jgi:hypothetical protein